jgi:hypothetical protein
MVISVVAMGDREDKLAKAREKLERFRRNKPRKEAAPGEPGAAPAQEPGPIEEPAPGPAAPEAPLAS